MQTDTMVPMTHERTRIILIVMTAVVSALGVIGIVPATFVPSMFGSPESHGDGLTTAAVGTVVGFPVVCAVSVIGSWLLWRGRRDTAACVVMVAPPSVMLILFIILLALSY